MLRMGRVVVVVVWVLWVPTHPRLWLMTMEWFSSLGALFLLRVFKNKNSKRWGSYSEPHIWVGSDFFSCTFLMVPTISRVYFKPYRGSACRPSIYCLR